MDKFQFSYPTKVYFGEGSAEQAFGAELSKLSQYEIKKRRRFV